MTTEHEALKHAALLSAEKWPAYMTLHKWADIAGDTIRTQHALIVQMAEALSELAELTELTRTGDYKPDSFTTQPANRAIAAATQYLKGPKT